MKAKKIIFRTILISILLLAVIVGGYICYLQTNYCRIEDNLKLSVKNQQETIAKTDTEYSILTFNVGFGAYNHDFSFFMDKGKMKDGTEVQGEKSKAESEEIVLTNINGATEIIKTYNPDFCLLQEVDTFSTRSHFVNQKSIFETEFSGYGSVFGDNFHSVFLCYPLTDPHGSVQAGLLTFSRYKIREAIRRSYPVDESFITKFFDLDRCFVVTKIPVENGKDLVIINSHLSAYDKGGIIRKQQIEMLRNVLTAEYNNGNYVIVGGDFNHALCGTEKSFVGEQEIPEWVSVMSDDDIPEHFHIAKAENINEVPTCRSTDIPYSRGVNYVSVLDGFIFSDNILAEAENIDTDFKFSDHNPVILKFRLKE